MADTKTYDQAIQYLLDEGFYVAQESDGTTTYFYGPASIVRNEFWLGPPASRIHGLPLCKKGWKESYREPKSMRKAT